MKFTWSRSQGTSEKRGRGIWSNADTCGQEEEEVVKNLVFFFSLFHQRADDEALTRFLQTSLFLVASPILVKSMFLSFRSSLTLYFWSLHQSWSSRCSSLSGLP